MAYSKWCRFLKMLFEDTFRGKWHGYRPSLLGKKLLDHVLFIVWSLFVSSNIQCEWSGRSKHHPQQWCSVRPSQTGKSLMNHLAHDNGKALNLIKIPFLSLFHRLVNRWCLVCFWEYWFGNAIFFSKKLDYDPLLCLPVKAIFQRRNWSLNKLFISFFLQTKWPRL